MAFKFMKLVVDWDGADYTTRLGLGEDNTPVDLRFNGAAGYIENVHTIYFENYAGAAVEAGVSTYKTAGVVTDLVFFDPEYPSGRTLTQLATSELPSGVQGDVLYHNGTDWVKLAAGTSGDFLKTLGTSANPTWATVTSGESLWTDDASNAWLTTPRDIAVQGQSIHNCSTLSGTTGYPLTIQAGASTLSIVLEAGNTGAVDIFDSSISAKFDSSGITFHRELDMSGGATDRKITGLATGTVSGDAVALDGDGYIPIGDLPLSGTGAKGDLFVGTVATCSTLSTPITNGLVLTTDDTQTEGMKWAAVGVGSGLWQSVASRTSLIATEPIDIYNDVSMNGSTLDMMVGKIDNLNQFDSAGLGGVHIYDSTGASRGRIGASAYTLQCANAGIAMAGNDIVMGTGKITGLGNPSGAQDAATKTWVEANTLTNPMAANLVMGGYDITGVDDIVMDSAGSYINMGYGTIYDSGNITMYKANVDSPVLSLTTTDTESGTGMWMYVAAGKTLKIYENFGNTLLAQLDYAGDLSLVGGLSVGSGHKVTGLAAASGSGEAVRYDEFSTHESATTGVHGVGANTIEHTGHKGAASGYCDLDADSRVPNNRYMLTTKGYLLVGATTTTCNTLAIGGTNGHVLTADSAQTLGVKWAAVGAGSGLWQTSGTRTSLITTEPIDLYDDVDMHGTGFDNIGTITMKDAFSWIAMSGAKITGLASGTTSGEALQYDQIMWEVVSGKTQLKTSDAINIQGEEMWNVDELIAFGTSGVRVFSSGVASRIRLGTTSYAFECQADANMDTYSITGVGHITFHPHTSAPATALGRLYYDNNSDVLKYYNGVSWKTLATV